MTVPSRRVWRAGLPTLLIVGIFAGVIGIALPVLAYLIYRREQTPWLPVVLLVLAVLTLLYAWRYGLHPKIWTRGHVLRIDNPFRRYEFDWDDITLIAPGENGLVVASEDQVAEAWCVQKSTAATRKGRFTRADRIASSLLDTLELYHPPISDEETGLRIRRARPHESAVLTRIERATSKVGLAHIFPADQFPYPTDAVAKRWRQLLHDRSSRVHILESVRDARRLCCFHRGHDPSSRGRPQEPTTGLRVGAAGVRLAGNLRRRYLRGAGLGLGRQSCCASVLPIARLAGHR